MSDCVFCKIANKEVSSNIVFEDDDFVVFEDINPFGPVALLVAPRDHIETIVDLDEKSEALSALMILGIKMVKKYNLDKKGFSFHINGGGVQEVNHLHLKIGGAWMSPESPGYPKW